MVDDEELRAKLAKVEALFQGAAGPGERAAAAAAIDRLQGRPGGSDGDREPEVELKFSLPDMWSVWLEFSMLHTELEIYFQDVANHLITRALRSDGDDNALDRQQLPAG